MASTQELLDILNTYKGQPDAYGYRLRLDLSLIVMKGMKAKGWSQRQLADGAMMHEAFIYRVVHADVDCTMGETGRILYALGVHAGLTELDDD